MQKSVADREAMGKMIDTMGMRVKILGSSSAGNCVLVSTEDCHVLVDAGLSGRRIAGLLEDEGLRPEKIDAIFLTHEHSDHCAGIKGLARYGKFTVYANRATATVVSRKLTRAVPWKVFETGHAFTFRDLEVSPYMIPHDACDPVAFVIGQGGQDLFSPHRSVAWVTDLGYIPEAVRERVRTVDMLILEANYDTDLLEADEKRPWSVKQRIRGRHGHLSNEAALSYLKEVSHPAWRQVFLAHLSRDCNDMGQLQRDLDALNAPFAADIVDPSNGACPAIAW